MKTSENRMKLILAALGCAAVFLLLFFPGKTWYSAYMEKQDARTCRKVRLSMLQEYEKALAGAEQEGRLSGAESAAGPAAGSAADPEVCAELFEQCVPAGAPSSSVIEKGENAYTLIGRGPCVRGGESTIYLDETDPADPYKVRICCSVHGDEVMR